MMKKHKKILSIVAVLAVVALLLLGYVKQDIVAPEFPQPASVNESLVPYYVGNIALDLPKSWEMGNFSANFYLQGQEKGPKIYFWESPAQVDRGSTEELEKMLDSVKALKTPIDTPQAIMGRTDLSETIGLPAWIVIKEDFISNASILQMNLELAIPQALLNFEYSENIVWPDNMEKMSAITDKQGMFLNWVIDFISRFQWIGNNSRPPDQFLATKYGQIALGDEWPELRYEFNANFQEANFLNNIEQRYANFFISTSSLPIDQANQGQANREVGEHSEFDFKAVLKENRVQANRDVGGRSGLEGKAIKNWEAKTGLAKLKIWEPDLMAMDLAWYDRSAGPFSRYNPKYEIIYSGRGAYADLAQNLAIWDSMLNSVRIIPEAN